MRFDQDRPLRHIYTHDPNTLTPVTAPQPPGTNLRKIGNINRQLAVSTQLYFVFNAIPALSNSLSPSIKPRLCIII